MLFRSNPKAKSMQYYSAHRKTEHCKYMSRKTIAFWAMHMCTLVRLPIRSHLLSAIYVSSSKLIELHPFYSQDSVKLHDVDLRTFCCPLLVT